MGNKLDKLVRAIGFIAILAMFLLAAVDVKADTLVEIKIPEEIKIKEVKEYSEESKIGDFEDHTSLFPQLTQEETEMLQKMAVAESGSAGIDSMAYVIQTILNRVSSDKFPDTIKEVVSQKGQFSTYPGKYSASSPTSESLEALGKALDMENRWQLYFENTYEGSWQSTHLEFLFKEGAVSFYR